MKYKITVLKTMNPNIEDTEDIFDIFEEAFDEEEEEISAAERFRGCIRMVYELMIAPTYRIPRLVKKICVYPDECLFGVCPRCGISVEREFQSFCDRCGQKLDWSQLNKAEWVWVGGKQ